MDAATAALWEECAARRHAARGRDHPARPPARRLRRDPGRRASGSSATTCCRSTCRCSATTAQSIVGLMGLITQRVFDYSDGYPPAGARARPRAPAGDRGGPQRAASRGSSPRARTRPSWTATSAARTSSTSIAHRGPGEGGRPRPLLPGDPGLRRDRRRPRRAAGGAHQRPSRRRWSTTCRRSTGVDGSPRDAADLRPGRPAGRPRWSRPPSTRTSAGSRWSGSSPARCARRPPCTSPGTAWRSAATPTTTPTSGSRTSTRRWAASCARCRTASPATSARSPSRARAETGDTLSTKDNPLLMAPWEMPEPLLPVAIVAKTRSDEDALAKNLGRLVAGDPTHAAGAQRRDPPAGAVVHGRGARRRRARPAARRRGRARHRAGHGWRCARRSPAASKGHGRHVKQSGGHGQYAVCDIEVEPLPRGVGLRVRRQGGRRRGAAQLHPVGGEGRARPDGARHRRRLPGRRPAGDALRRQGAQRRLVRRGVPDRRRAGAQGRRREGPGARCSSRSTRSSSGCRTRSSAR